MEEDQSLFVEFSYFMKFFLDLLHGMLCIKSVGKESMLFNSFDYRDNKRVCNESADHNLYSFDYRDNKRVCNESADHNLCKTKWHQNGHFCGNRYQGRHR